MNFVTAGVALFAAGLLLGTTKDAIDIPIKELFVVGVLIWAAVMLAYK